MMHVVVEYSHSIRRALFIVAFALVLSLGASQINADDCYEYYDSKLIGTYGYTYCGGYGLGCTECVDDSGNSCVTNGETCRPRQDHAY